MSLQLSEIVESIYNESNLGGYSRSGQKPRWEHYLVPTYNKDSAYFIDKATKLVDKSGKVVGSVSPKEEIRILSPKLELIGTFRYAHIKKVDGGMEGYVSPAAIKKPAGGKDVHSKEFTPDKLGLAREEYKDVHALVETSIRSLETHYSEESFTDIRNYLTECMNVVSGEFSGALQEKKEYNTFKLSKKYNISQKDTQILSKNFGEVIAAIYVFSTNKRVTNLKFSEAINAPMYDFSVSTSIGIDEFYSVKALGGSSTSMANLNFFLNSDIEKGNKVLRDNKKTLDLIRSLMNSKGRNTITNIQEFFDNTLRDEKNEILKRLNTISKSKINSLETSVLTSWFNDVKKNSTLEEFLTVMNGIYFDILGGKHASEAALTQMFESGISKNNGFLYYPMAAFIVKHLNEDQNCKNVLNTILNSGVHFHQCSVDLSPQAVKVSIEQFENKKFKFSYNGMAKEPANRPIGFEEDNKA